MKRGELKQLIKECLIEILAEGIGAERLEETIQRSPAQHKQKPVQVKQAQSQPRFNPALDQKVIQPRQMIVPKKSKEDIMSSIMEETARSMAEINQQTGFSDNSAYSEPTPVYDSGPGSSINDGNGPNYQEHFRGDPLAIFGGGGNSAMWQKAAFGTPRPK